MTFKYLLVGALLVFTGCDSTIEAPPMSTPIPQAYPDYPDVPPDSQPTLPHDPPSYSFNVIEYQKVRNAGVVNGSSILGDIESHMPQSHIYRSSDIVTWAHETTHGLNSNIRNKHGGTGRVNAFYILNNKAVVMQEPNYTLRQLASAVPSNLRGMSYRLYLVQQQQYWNNEPLYVFDEATAYLNGAKVGFEVGHKVESELLQAFEMIGYALVLAEQTKSKEIGDFAHYLYKEAHALKQKWGPSSKIDAHVSKLATAFDLK